MNYVFERMHNAEYRYQVRLQGIFVCYSNIKDDRVVDALLRAEGFETREDFVNEHVQILAEYFMSCTEGE